MPQLVPERNACLHRTAACLWYSWYHGGCGRGNRYGDFHPVTEAGRWVAIVYIFSACFIAVNIIANFATLPAMFHRRTTDKLVSDAAILLERSVKLYSNGCCRRSCLYGQYLQSTIQVLAQFDPTIDDTSPAPNAGESPADILAARLKAQHMQFSGSRTTGEGAPLAGDEVGYYRS